MSIFEWLLKTCFTIRVDVWYIVLQIRNLSHDVASGSDITPCIEIDKPIVVYIFCNVTTVITTSHIYGKLLVFSHKKHGFKVV